MTTLAYGPDPDQVVDVYEGGGEVPVVYLHGGFWRPRTDRSHARPLAEALAAAGHPVHLVEYRRVPGEPDVTVGDARAALALAPPGAVLVGHSAGGHLALLAGTASPPPGLRGVVALAPVADLALAERLDLGAGAVGLFLGGPAADRPDLDPGRLPRPGVPVTVLHGDRDDEVPLEVGQAYAPEAVVLESTGHYEFLDPATPTWARMLAEVRALASAG